MSPTTSASFGSNSPRYVSGKWFIVSILGLALVAAGVAWWNQYRQGQRVLATWGAENAFRIRHAPKCTLLRLERATRDGESGAVGVIGGVTWVVRQERDVSQSPGYVHARQALIVDHQYLWDAPQATSEMFVGSYALRFSDPRGETLLLFDLQHGLVVDGRGTGATLIHLGPILQAGLSEIFAETFDESARGVRMTLSRRHHTPRSLPAGTS